MSFQARQWHGIPNGDEGGWRAWFIRGQGELGAREGQAASSRWGTPLVSRGQPAGGGTTNLTQPGPGAHHGCQNHQDPRRELATAAAFRTLRVCRSSSGDTRTLSSRTPRGATLTLSSCTPRGCRSSGGTLTPRVFHSSGDILPLSSRTPGGYRSSGDTLTLSSRTPRGCRSSGNSLTLRAVRATKERSTQCAARCNLKDTHQATARTQDRS